MDIKNARTNQGRVLSVRVVNKAFSDPVALCASIIALCALGVTIWQGSLMRQHNRMSLLPWIDLQHNFALPNEWLGTSIANEGQGPAFVQTVQLVVNGRLIDNTRRNGWPLAAEELGLKKNWVKFRSFNQDDVVRPDDEKPLFGTPPSEASSERKTQLREAVQKLTVHVCYCSVYSDCFFIEDRYRGKTFRGRVRDCSSYRPESRLIEDKSTLQAAEGP